MTARIRTRFAPSPTGFIHLGNIRSALYPWAFARANGGDFILRIEDTDLERSSQAAVDVILESMAWLALDPDEGPYYQMQRMDRYKAVLAELQAAGHVYPCYMSMTELDALREHQMAAKEKPRYDGTWRPAPGKALPPVPEGIKPVLRFKNPQTAHPPTTSAWWSTTSTWPSPTSSAATTTSTTRRARSISSKRWAGRHRCTPICPPCSTSRARR
jgi:glutamyl-tRNA synthetase